MCVSKTILSSYKIITKHAPGFLKLFLLQSQSISLSVCISVPKASSVMWHDIEKMIGYASSIHFIKRAVVSIIRRHGHINLVR